MSTHYDVLGVRSSATGAQIRRAYVAKARTLHPDVFSGRPDEDIAAARRAMQDVNEAWRVLRDPERRDAYDRSLRAAPVPTQPHPTQARPDEDDGWLDRPYRGRPAEPGDLTVALVRAAPWVAVLAVLVAIFVFTAFARNGDDSTNVVGKCISTERDGIDEVPCTAPDAGRVVNIVQQANRCTNGAVPKMVAGGAVYCLRPVADE